jgi:hypothetical protein
MEFRTGHVSGTIIKIRNRAGLELPGFSGQLGGLMCCFELIRTDAAD